MGEGECRQDDGEYGLRYMTELHYVGPGNADQAKEKCLRLCAKYIWCYAGQISLYKHRYNAKWQCRLMTDRPTFEHVYGQGQDYSDNTMKDIDGISYLTYDCGYGSTDTNGSCTDSDGNIYNSLWGGGRLSPHEQYYCYRKIDLWKGISQLLKPN